MKFNEFIPHLSEIRRRLFYSLGLMCFFFICFLNYSDRLFNIIAHPLLQQNQVALIATHVTTPFTTPLKLAFFTTLMCSSPFILHQFWTFISPALYPNERKWFRWLLFFSCILFFLGASFAYFIVCPMALLFFHSVAPASVTLLTDMHHYLDFVLALTMSFGFCFQAPLITFLILSSKLLTLEQLSKKRPLIIVLAFTLGMIFTPPDVISQIMLAIPLWLLFELGLLLYKYSRPSNNLTNSTSTELHSPKQREYQAHKKHDLHRE